MYNLLLLPDILDIFHASSRYHLLTLSDILDMSHASSRYHLLTLSDILDTFQIRLMPPVGTIYGLV